MIDTSSMYRPVVAAPADELTPRMVTSVVPKVALELNAMPGAERLRSSKLVMCCACTAEPDRAVTLIGTSCRFWARF